MEEYFQIGEISKKRVRLVKIVDNGNQCLQAEKPSEKCKLLKEKDTSGNANVEDHAVGRETISVEKFAADQLLLGAKNSVIQKMLKTTHSIKIAALIILKSSYIFVLLGHILLSILVLVGLCFVYLLGCLAFPPLALTLNYFLKLLSSTKLLCHIFLGLLFYI